MPLMQEHFTTVLHLEILVCQSLGKDPMSLAEKLSPYANMFSHTDVCPPTA